MEFGWIPANQNKIMLMGFLLATKAAVPTALNVALGYSTGVWEHNLAGIRTLGARAQYPWSRENCDLTDSVVGLLKDSVLSSF